MPGFVYILKSDRNGTYYIGSTKNFKRRIIEHQNGRSKYTRHLLPLSIAFVHETASLTLARQIERKLKRMKSKLILDRIITSQKIDFLENLEFVA